MCVCVCAWVCLGGNRFKNTELVEVSCSGNKCVASNTFQGLEDASAVYLAVNNLRGNLAGNKGAQLYLGANAVAAITCHTSSTCADATTAGDTCVSGVDVTSHVDAGGQLYVYLQAESGISDCADGYAFACDLEITAVRSTRHPTPAPSFSMSPTPAR